MKIKKKWEKIKLNVLYSELIYGFEFVYSKTFELICDKITKESKQIVNTLAPAFNFNAHCTNIHVYIYV